MMKKVRTIDIIYFQNIFDVLGSLGLSVINSTTLDPKSCSRRKCFYSDSLLYSIWTTEQVKRSCKHFINMKEFFNKILPGCDCCEVDGQLVEDKFTWMKENITYGKYI